MHFEWYHYCFLGVWVVYKFKYYIPSGNLFNDGTTGEYKTLNEARFKTYKSIHEQHPDKEIDLIDTKDKHVAYFVIEFVVGIIKFISVPVKK